MGYFEYFKIFATPESITVAVILLFAIIYRSIIRPRLLLLEEYEKTLGEKLKHILPPDELVTLIKKSTPADMLEVLLNSVNTMHLAMTSHDKNKLSHSDFERIISSCVSEEFRRLMEFSKKEHGEIKYLLGLIYMIEEDQSKVDLTKAMDILTKIDSLLKIYRAAQHTNEEVK